MARKLAGQQLSDSPEIPIWMPAIGTNAGGALFSPARAVARGLHFHTLEQTIRDTLEWQKQRPAAQQTLRVGLPPDREAQLLRVLRNG